MSAKILKDNNLTYFILLRSLAIPPLFVISCLSIDARAQTRLQSAVPALQQGLPLPEFSMKSSRGNTWTTDKFLNKITVVSFWYIGSGPGMEELRYLNLLMDSIAHKDFQVVSFARNTSVEIGDFLSDSSRDYALTRELFNVSLPRFEVIPACHYIFQRQNDGCAYLSDSLGIIAYPTTLLLDRQGRVRILQRGFPVPDEQNKANVTFPDATTKNYFDYWLKEVQKLLAE